jgi:hypothetical protein
VFQWVITSEIYNCVSSRKLSVYVYIKRVIVSIDNDIQKVYGVVMF